MINNINEEAYIYQNRADERSKNNYLKISFKGKPANLNGIGAHAQIFYDNTRQSLENTPYRGYLSTVEDGLHFGVGSTTTIDSIIIKWPDNGQQVLKNIHVNQNLVVWHRNAVDSLKQEPFVLPQTLFSNVTAASGISYRHYEQDFVDFNYQKLLPHKLSQYGPPLAAGDIDNNGLDDIFIGASAGNYAIYFLQQATGKFIQRELPPVKGKDARQPEMMGSLLFDADEDGDLDLYTCSGGNEFLRNTKSYQDQFFKNTGKGSFVPDSAALPQNFTSKSCIKATDFDNDGDLDLFIGGRLNPERYPEPVNSFIYRNDSRNGQIRFTDVTNELAPFLQKIGLVCDAVWTDFDNDGWQDLVLAGEWMPLSFLKNDKGIFKNITAATGLQDNRGWWTSITPGDFDNDGDMDFVAGNLGLNSFFKASDKEPVRIYAGDFDDDPSYEAIPTRYLKDATGNKKEYPASVRDDMIKQMISMRRQFPTYKSFAEADINSILSKEQRSKALVLSANFLASTYIQNNGNKGFEAKPLPAQAQFAPLNGMVAEDVNADGWLDLIITGNDYGNEVVNGRYDALSGLVLLGNGKGGFHPLALKESGFYVPGDAKGLASLVINNRYTLAATQNRSTMELFLLKTNHKILPFKNDDLWAVVQLKNGGKRKMEISYGHSFLSQSTRFLKLNNMVQSVHITNRKGRKREANLSLSSASH